MTEILSSLSVVFFLYNMLSVREKNSTAPIKRLCKWHGSLAGIQYQHKVLEIIEVYQLLILDAKLSFLLCKLI